MGRIVDNQKDLADGIEHLNMIDIFQKYVEDSNDFKFHVGTGFFFLDGFGELYNKLDLNKLNLGSDQYSKKWGTEAPILVLMGKETNQTTKESLIDAQNKIKYALNINDDDYLSFLEKLIHDNLIKFKVFTDTKFHAKIYFFYEGDSVDDIYVGSANLTSAGLQKNIELTAPINTDKFYKKSHVEWFKTLWDKSTEDLNVLEVINNYKKHDFIYYEPNNFFKNLIKLMEKEYLFYNSDISDNTLLVKFQSFDFYQVMSTLEKYNGCILASSVGLGKSYVALEVMRYFENNDMEALLIGPSNLVKGRDSVWKEYLERYDLEVETIGYGDLQQGKFNANKYIKYDLIVVDEAHNLRNASNTRKNILEVIKNSPHAKFLFLTATPINVKISDLNSLIDLFYEVNRHNWLDKDLKSKYEEFRSKVNKLEKQNTESKKLFKEVVTLQKFIEKELIVKSTRSMVRKYFSNDLIRLAGTDELHDPEVISETYNYPSEYHSKFFDKLPDFLLGLNYEHSKFHDDGEKGPTYKEDRNLIYMYKWLLYKRAESSIYAFYSSINALEKRLRVYKAHLENKVLDEDLSDFVNRELKERLNIAKKIYESINDDKDRKKIIENMDKDIESISEMIREINSLRTGMTFKNDTKLERLKEILTENNDKKCLIFTEYYHTLKYLVKNLPEFSIEHVAGKDLKGQVMKPSQKEKRIRMFKEDKFNHLISTDVLAEGFNIPEADIVINYDLPYNPVKIIQRVGRATRINVPKKIEIRNFNPDESIDQELNLIDRLSLRISNIISMIGIDYSIWANTEEMIKEREKLDSVNKCKILKELKKRFATENPEEIYQIQLREESKLDILLKNSIEHYNIRQEDIPVRNPSKPIYTTLINKEAGFFGIYEFNKDYFEFGEPAPFIEEHPKPIKQYNEKEITEFCEIIKKNYMDLIGRMEDRSNESLKDKETLKKLKKIKKDIPALIPIVNQIMSTKIYTNFQISEIVKKDIYPQIVRDDFSCFLEAEKIDKWKSDMESILENEGAKEISHMDEWIKKPEEYKKMIKAFIQYKGADLDI